MTTKGKKKKKGKSKGLQEKMIKKIIINYFKYIYIYIFN